MLEYILEQPLCTTLVVTNGLELHITNRHLYLCTENQRMLVAPALALRTSWLKHGSKKYIHILQPDGSDHRVTTITPTTIKTESYRHNACVRWFVKK